MYICIIYISINLYICIYIYIYVRRLYIFLFHSKYIGVISIHIHACVVGIDSKVLYYINIL